MTRTSTTKTFWRSSPVARGRRHHSNCALEDAAAVAASLSVLTDPYLHRRVSCSETSEEPFLEVLRDASQKALGHIMANQ